MYKNKKFFALIPARGGSKRVKNKNLYPISGKPLIAWTIEAAKKSRFIDRVIVSSEDSEILEQARYFGAETPFVRPIELAQDQSSGIDPVLHAIDQIVDFDFVVLLQPTSPLRQTQDIDDAIVKISQENANCLVSVTEVDKRPDWMYTLTSTGKMLSVLPEESKNKTDQIYVLNGAIYIANTKWLQKNKNFLTDETIAYPMPRSRSLDIDTPEDIFLCQAVMQKTIER